MGGLGACKGRLFSHCDRWEEKCKSLLWRSRGDCDTSEINAANLAFGCFLHANYFRTLRVYMPRTLETRGFSSW